MSKLQNFYEVLNSTPNSTFDELKSNYKLLILQCHPDKLQQDKVKETTTKSSLDGATVDPNAAGDENAEFVMINKAWNTLKDPVKRKLYDAELLLTKFQMHSNIFERLTLDDMLEHEELEDELSAEEEEVEMGMNMDMEKSNCDKNIEQQTKNNNQDLLESKPTSKSRTQSKSVSYFYTYNCRCGGQYVIDESAAADNGIYKGGSNSTKMLATTQQNIKRHNHCDNVDDKSEAGATASTSTSADVGAGADGGVGADVEVLVECSECSLVITLSNEQQKSKTSHSTTS